MAFSQKASDITQKSQEIGIKLTITDYSNFDKWCSDAHFVSFLFPYYCMHNFAELGLDMGNKVFDLWMVFFKSNHSTVWPTGL